MILSKTLSDSIYRIFVRYHVQDIVSSELKGD